MDIGIKHFSERDARRLHSEAKLAYQRGVSSAVRDSMRQQGEEDGARAAAGIVPEPPDAADLKKAELSYRSAYAAAFARALEKRGAIDGAAAANGEIDLLLSES